MTRPTVGETRDVGGRPVTVLEVGGRFVVCRDSGRRLIGIPRSRFAEARLVSPPERPAPITRPIEDDSAAYAALCEQARGT